MPDEDYELKLKAIKQACTQKKYQFTETSIPGGIRLDISDGQNQIPIPINIYINGGILVQGKNSPFRGEMVKLTQEMEKNTPRLTEIAEKNVKEKIDLAYDYVESHDRKYFVAAECLLLANISLPEYSPIVMPASKAFEGFARKIMCDIGLCPDGFDNFHILKQNVNSLAKENVISKDNHCKYLLNDLSRAVHMCRNFMMHSDESPITKLDSYEEANEKLAEIYTETKKFFQYFNKIFGIYKIT